MELASIKASFQRHYAHNGSPRFLSDDPEVAIPAEDRKSHAMSRYLSSDYEVRSTLCILSIQYLSYWPLEFQTKIICVSKEEIFILQQQINLNKNNILNRRNF